MWLNLVFDLIVSDSIDGITGDFGNLSILGLDPSYSVTAGTVIDDLGAGQVEIYRLQIDRDAILEQVPEPEALLLTAFGLAGFGFARRRRPRF